MNQVDDSLLKDKIQCKIVTKILMESDRINISDV